MLDIILEESYWPTIKARTREANALFQNGFQLSEDDIKAVWVDPGKKAALIERMLPGVAPFVKSKREKLAKDLVDAYWEGTPSDRFAAHQLIVAIGYDPQKIERKIITGDYKAAVARIADKLASW